MCPCCRSPGKTNSASRHRALSYGPAETIEAQLKMEVQQLLTLAETADGVNVPDGMSVPEELQRRGLPPCPLLRRSRPNRRRRPRRPVAMP